MLFQDELARENEALRGKTMRDKNLNADQRVELLESWINGNRRHVAGELLKYEPEEIVWFCFALANEGLTKEMFALQALITQEKQGKRR